MTEQIPYVCWLLMALAFTGALGSIIEFVALRIVRRRKFPTPKVWPGISLLKPLAGVDEELTANLESHLRIDYPGDWEIILGVRDIEDAAYPVARAFADAHKDRVRLVLQESSPGFNPKVNQLITMTKYARYEVIAGTDSNVRVHPGLLSEHACVLAKPGVALSSHAFAGVGEKSVGATLDNMTLCAFVCTSSAIGDVVFRITQVVGKSYAIKREVLDQVGGWRAVKDVLAEDQQLGQLVMKKGFKAHIAPGIVQNFQRQTTVDQFFLRHARWAMIRFRVFPAVFLEPWLYFFTLALFAVLSAPTRALPWGLLAASYIVSVALAHASALEARGHSFSTRWLLLAPLREIIFAGTYVYGFFMRTVTWRGNAFEVGERTALSPVFTPAGDEVPTES